MSMVLDMGFHVSFIMTDIITKCDRSLSQNVSGFLLQNATVLLKNAIV